MIKRFLQFALFSLVLQCVLPTVVAAAGSDDSADATKTGEMVKQKYPVSAMSKAIQDKYGRPTIVAIIKNIVAFGGPLALMIIANRKLKKDREARIIKLKEQQEAQGGNPMAQLMAMMQQQGGMGGLPGAEVRQPAVQTPVKEVKPEDMVEQVKPYERHILSAGMRRFWTATSWVCSFFAFVNGLGLGFNLWAVAKGNNVPSAMRHGENALQEACEAVERIKPGNIENQATNATWYAAQLVADPRIKKVMKSIRPKDKAEKKKYEDHHPVFKQEIHNCGSEFADRVHYHADKHLQENWLARGWRFLFGNDLPTRAIMNLKDFNRPIVAENAGEHKDATSLD